MSDNSREDVTDKITSLTNGLLDFNDEESDGNFEYKEDGYLDGKFSGEFKGNLEGNATSASTVNIKYLETSEQAEPGEEYFIPFVEKAESGSPHTLYKKTIKYNAKDDVLTVRTVNGNVDGTAAQADSIKVEETKAGDFSLALVDQTDSYSAEKYSKGLKFNAGTNTLTVKNVDGNASTATLADTIKVKDIEEASTIAAVKGSDVLDTKLSFNEKTKTITANIEGTATNATNLINENGNSSYSYDSLTQCLKNYRIEVNSSKISPISGNVNDISFNFIDHNKEKHPFSFYSVNGEASKITIGELDFARIEETDLYETDKELFKHSLTGDVYINRKTWNVYQLITPWYGKIEVENGRKEYSSENGKTVWKGMGNLATTVDTVLNITQSLETDAPRYSYDDLYNGLDKSFSMNLEANETYQFPFTNMSFVLTGLNGKMNVYTISNNGIKRVFGDTKNIVFKTLNNQVYLTVPTDCMFNLIGYYENIDLTKNFKPAEMPEEAIEATGVDTDSLNTTIAHIIDLTETNQLVGEQLAQAQTNLGISAAQEAADKAQETADNKAKINDSATTTNATETLSAKKIYELVSGYTSEVLPCSSSTNITIKNETKKCIVKFTGTNAASINIPNPKSDDVECRVINVGSAMATVTYTGINESKIVLYPGTYLIMQACDNKWLTGVAGAVWNQ